MQGILYQEGSFWPFLLVTCVIGGGLAWMTGRATAKSWRSYPHLAVYVLLLGCALRFIHFALFNGTFIAPRFYLIDTLFVSILAVLGFLYTRTSQMTGQYRWLYEKTSAFSFRARAPNSPSAALGHESA